jgi:transcription elongation factor GreA
MTLNGYQKLQDEVRRLKGVERPQVVDAIATARAYGDLSENAEYSAAKERQGVIEARIAEIEEKLSMAEVIDVSKIDSDTVKFGSTVEIKDHGTGTVSKFQIVSSDEADIKTGRLPITSPIAKSLIGKSVGDVIEVDIPSGARSYAVLSIEHV